MWTIVVSFSLLSALLNAVGSLTQRRATGQIDVRRLFRHSIVIDALKNRQWLIGGAVQLAAFIAQAIALHAGPLVVVGPLMTTDLVFLMLLLRAYLHIRIGRREWLGALAISSGLSVLLVSADPRGGDIPVNFHEWIVVILVVAVLVLSGAVWMRRGPAPPLRAAIGGMTAGVHFALTAALIKLVMQQWNLGVAHEFLSWPLWVLTIVGVTSFVSLQSMYGAGPLAISWPIVEITEALSGVVIGLTLFGDVVNSTPLALAFECLGAGTLAAGIVLLAGSSRLRGSET
ncbi:MAG TPA: DMT family transporter [Candidatus Saccharimonadales bacterium]|nr:DMT family transporter [Candidatus Saccharimonadales bacterium]